MKDFSEMQVVAKELKIYRLQFYLNGYPATGKYQSLDYLLNYLDCLKRNGAKITELRIIEENYLYLE